MRACPNCGSNDLDRWIPQSHFLHLYDAGTPPPGAVMWLAAYGGRERLATHTSFRWPPTDSDLFRLRGQADGYGVTLSVGALVVQMLHDPGTQDISIQVADEARDFVVRVWPTRPVRVSWPPRHSLDDAGLGALSVPTGHPPLPTPLTPERGQRWRL